MVSAYNITHPADAFRSVVNALPGESAAQERDKALQASRGTAPPALPTPTDAQAHTLLAPNAAPAAGGAAQETISPEATKALLEGNIIPMLAPLLAHSVDLFNQGPPKPSDYPTQADYDAAELAFSGDGTDANPGALGTVISLSTQLANAQKLSSGRLTLGDGTVITQDMINSPDPYVAAQAKKAYEDASRQSFTDYNTTMNKAGLDQFTVDNTAAITENDRRTTEFNSKTDSWNAGLDYDKTAISRSADVINRQLNGLQESRARADLATKTLMDAAPYATSPGKTEFSPSDFGALAVQAGQMAGLSPNDVALRFPTTVHVDPMALMQQGDAALGVQGTLPLVAPMTTQPNSQPTPQPLVPGPAPVNVSRTGSPPTALGSMPLVGGAGAPGLSSADTIARAIQDELFRQQQMQAAQQQGIFG